MASTRSTCRPMWRRRRASPWSAWSPSADRSGRLAGLELHRRKRLRLGQAGEEVAARSIVIDQARVFGRDPGVIRVAGLPFAMKHDAAQANLHQLLEAVEAGLDRGVQECSVKGGAEAGGGEHRVLLGVDAQADVVEPARQTRARSVSYTH